MALGMRTCGTIFTAVFLQHIAQGLSYSQDGQDRFVERLFPTGFKGVFVEAGAADGISMSNTYHLERDLGWRGLLVEALPSQLNALRANRPAATVVHTCLAGTAAERHFSVMEDAQTSGLLDEGILTNFMAKAPKEVVKMQCQTLESLLIAQGMKHVDYLSLDVEGQDLHILRSLTGEVFIDVLSVEARPFADDVDAILHAVAGRYRMLDRVGMDLILRRIPSHEPYCINVHVSACGRNWDSLANLLHDCLSAENNQSNSSVAHSGLPHNSRQGFLSCVMADPLADCFRRHFYAAPGTARKSCAYGALSIWLLILLEMSINEPPGRVITLMSAFTGKLYLHAGIDDSVAKGLPLDVLEMLWNRDFNIQQLLASGWPVFQLFYMVSLRFRNLHMLMFDAESYNLSPMFEPVGPTGLETLTFPAMPLHILHYKVMGSALVSTAQIAISQACSGNKAWRSKGLLAFTPEEDRRWSLPVCTAGDSDASGGTPSPQTAPVGAALCTMKSNTSFKEAWQACVERVGCGGVLNGRSGQRMLVTPRFLQKELLQKDVQGIGDAVLYKITRKGELLEAAEQLLRHHVAKYGFAQFLSDTLPVSQKVAHGGSSMSVKRRAAADSGRSLWQLLAHC